MKVNYKLKKCIIRNKYYHQDDSKSLYIFVEDQSFLENFLMTKDSTFF